VSRRRRPRNRDPRPKHLSVEEVHALRAERPYCDPTPHLVIPPTTLIPGMPEEGEDGAHLYRYWSLRGLVVTHTPNEHLPSGLVGSLKKQGMIPGWPDYSFARPVYYDGAWRTVHIEAKRGCNWKVSRAQADCIRRLWADGQIAELYWGMAWGIELTEAFYGR